MSEQGTLTPRQKLQLELESLRAEHAVRNDEHAELRLAQEIADLKAQMDLELEHGIENVASLEVPFTPGKPTKIIARLPKVVEMKRYRARVKGRDPDAVLAAEEIADVARVYPDKETFDALCDERPGIKAQLGVAALKLGAARAESEGKD
jgi:hypothetical protein